ncbi:MAG: mandelate racemase/muconate lactonizing enzyme family protein [Acidimicrobiales bacterium]
MKITGLKCATIGNNLVVRITTDEGVSGYGEIERYKPYLKWHVMYYEPFIAGQDPTNVERVMRLIRHLGAFKPWGSAVSAIEMALWDIAGKAAGLPVYKLLGGKVRDRVRVYNGAIRFEQRDNSPEAFAEVMTKMKGSPEKFTIIKQSIAFHGSTSNTIPGFYFGDPDNKRQHASRGGLLTEKGLKHVIGCVEAMRAVLGEDVGLALDCGPGWTLPDAIWFARAMEGFNVLWLEDLLTGDYVPHVDADIYRELTRATSANIHTGEQIYLRQNFKDLIETNAVRVVGPDPCDVGGIAELKWVAEYADLHGVLMAPHGLGNGLLGMAALVQVCATLPPNYIAFEYPIGDPSWWYDIVIGYQHPVVVDGFITVPDRPGMGVEFDVESARRYLAPHEEDFFD